MKKRLGALAKATLAAGLMIFQGMSGYATASSSLFVSTMGNDSDDCLSPATPCRTIQTAIDKAADGDTINVAAGSYPEAIFINNRERLTIIGTIGTTINDPGLSPGMVLISVTLSRDITLRDLIVTGNSSDLDGIRIFDSRGVSIDRCTIERFGSSGVFVNNLSSVAIQEATIQDNGIGIRVAAGSRGSLSTVFAPATSTVQRNVTGIVVDEAASFGLYGNSIVRDNNVGINIRDAALISCCAQGSRRINNNNTGILLRGANLDLRGPLLMEGNQAFAIRMFAGSAIISNTVTIRNNGSRETAAISVTGGHLQLNGREANDIEISNSPGNGLTLTDNASARILNTVIKNNGVHGIRLQALSSAALLDSAVMRDNGGFDFSCTPNSFGRGSDTGVRRMSCPSFDKSPDPDPGGPDNL